MPPAALRRRYGAAKAEAVEIVSVSATSEIPSAPATSSGRSEADSTRGTVSGGNPLGRVPTSETPWAARSNTDAAAIATMTATSTPGTRGSQRSSAMINPRLTRPIATAAPTASPEASPCTKAIASLIKPFASVEKPKSLGSCPIRIVSASPFM